MNHINKVLIILLIILLIFIVILTNVHHEHFLSYKKCHKYINNKLLRNFLNNYNINHNNQNWDIYIPCEYTNVEKELQHINTNNELQIIIGISHCDKLAAKDKLWLLFEKKLGRKMASNYLPETYVLYNNSHKELFKTDFNPNNMYLLKKNIQRKSGIKLTNNLTEILNNNYNNYVIVQKYIDNLFLINNRKINLRMYLLLICYKGSVKWYISTLGKCLYSNKDYNYNNYDNEVHLTNFNTNSNIYSINPLTLIDLQKYLGNKKYALLFSRIINIMKKCKYVYYGELCLLQSLQSNICMQLFGMDFIFTKSLKPYLLEINKGPQMNYINNIEKNLKYTIIEDMFKKTGRIIYNTKKDTHFIEI